MAKNNRSSKTDNSNKRMKGKFVAKSGCKMTSYKNAGGDLNDLASGWNSSKKGFLTFKAHKLSESGASNIAKARGYNDYSNETENGNERWFYSAEFTKADSVVKEYYTGICIFKPKERKMYFSRFSMVASFNAPHGGYFGKI